MELIELEAERYVNKAGDIVIAPLGDIQYLPGELCTTWVDGLRDYIGGVLNDGGYFLGMGDYIDFASPSNRGGIRRADLYDKTTGAIEWTARDINEALYKAFLAPTAERWMGMLSGHHYFQFEDGRTSDTELAEVLGAKHLGDCAIVRLGWEDGEKVDIWMHHGQGSGNALSRLEKVSQSWNADVFLMGHYTQLGYKRLDRVYLDITGPALRLGHRPMHLVATGGWSKAYLEDNSRAGVAAGCYVEKALYPPAALGGAILKIRRLPSKTPVITVQL